MSTAGNPKRSNKNLLAHNFPENRFPVIQFEDTEKMQNYYRVTAVPIWEKIIEFVETCVQLVSDG